MSVKDRYYPNYPSHTCTIITNPLLDFIDCHLDKHICCLYCRECKNKYHLLEETPSSSLLSKKG